LAVTSLCGGWFIPYVSLLCPVIAVVLAVLSLKTRRKALPIVALVFSIISFCALISLGWFVWTPLTTGPGANEVTQSFAELFATIGQLIQTIIELIKVKLHI
jgi:TRAP-type C4-dicarboxylate transport system permease small subunit